MKRDPIHLSSSRRFALETLTDFAHDRTAAHPPPADLDWDWIGEFCRRHRLGPIFKELTGTMAPGPLRDEWQAKQRQNFAWNSRALPVAVKILAILEEAAVPVTAMRGLVLAHTLYPRPELRFMTDVDLLIRPEDKDAAEQALGQAGHQPVKRLRSQLVYQLNDTIFEIHYSFLTPKRYRDSLPPEEFLANRQSLALDAGPIWCLAPETELIGIIAHAFIHHDLDRFLPLTDAARLVLHHRKLDWKYIAQLGRRAGLERMLIFTLTFINDLFELEMEPSPEDVFGRRLSINHNKIQSAYLARLVADDDWGHYLRRKRHLFYVAESPATKFRQALRLLAPDEIKGLVAILRG